MRRRRVLAMGGVAVLSIAGCSSPGDTGVGSTAPPAERVTTTSADGIEVLVAQIAVGSDAAGPDAYYRLRNDGENDATVRIETVLTVEGGGTYSSFAVVTVPAGDEVTVRYQIVRFDELSEAERSRVRSGDGVNFEVFINGQRRAG